jgi:hypothetical protein
LRRIYGRGDRDRARRQKALATETLQQLRGFDLSQSPGDHGLGDAFLHLAIELVGLPGTAGRPRDRWQPSAELWTLHGADMMTTSTPFPF